MHHRFILYLLSWEKLSPSQESELGGQSPLPGAGSILQSSGSCCFCSQETSDSSSLILTASQASQGTLSTSAAALQSCIPHQPHCAPLPQATYAACAVLHTAFTVALPLHERNYKSLNIWSWDVSVHRLV